MTSRERLLAAIRHEEGDYVPVAPRMGDWLRGQKRGSWQDILRFADEYDFDPMIVTSGGLADYIWEGINTDQCAQLQDVKLEQTVREEGALKIVKKRFQTPAGVLTEVKKVPPPGGVFGTAPNPETVEWLLKTPEDIVKIGFLLPDPARAGGRVFSEMTEGVGERGLVELRPTVGSDGLLLQAMGMENAMVNARCDAPFLAAAFDLFHRYNLRVAKHWLEAGARVIFDSGYNMSLSTGWSPRDWRELFYPKVKAICALTHAYGAYYHFYDDGKFAEILPDLAGIGVDIVSTCTPPPIGDFDAARSKAAYGSVICFKGGIDVVDLMIRQTPDAVSQKVKELIGSMAKGGGFILGSSDSIRAETPLANFRAYFKAAREFGRYQTPANNAGEPPP